MLYIKIFGIILIVFSFGSYGFIAASRLQKRSLILREIYSKTDALKERIRSGAGELSQLLKICFEGCSSLKIEGSRVTVSKDFLLDEDIKILEDFFRELGSLDAPGEYSRICVFQNLINAQYKKATDESAKKSRLIKTAGISIGLALGILVI